MARPLPRTSVVTEVVGDKHLIHTMESWAIRAGRGEAAFTEIHHYLLNVEKELFDSEGASGDHGKWEDTQQRGTEDHPILQASGDLMRSLTEADDPHHQFLITTTSMAMGTDLPVYPEVHQRGTEHTPQRRVIDLTVKNREIMLGIISAWIVSGGAKPVGGLNFFRRGGSGRFT